MSSIKPSHSGIIGLGIVGSRIAAALSNQDLQVHVWNRSPKDLPHFANSAKEVAELADFIQLFVRNGQDVLEVINSMADALTTDHIIIAHATIAPKEAREAARAVAATGAAFLEAPFTGSKIAAENAALVYYLSGDPDTLEKARPLLELSSREIIHVGDRIGTAATLKIATNMVSATTGAILAEALSITLAQDIDPGKLIEAFKDNACHSPLIDMKLPSMAEDNFDPHFSLRNMFKDVQFGLDLGTEANLDLPVLSTVAGAMFTAMRAGHEEEDFSVLLTNYQQNTPPAPSHTLVPAAGASMPALRSLGKEESKSPSQDPDPAIDPDSHAEPTTEEAPPASAGTTSETPKPEASHEISSAPAADDIPPHDSPLPSPSSTEAPPLPVKPRFLPPKRPAAMPPRALTDPSAPLDAKTPPTHAGDALPPPSPPVQKPIPDPLSDTVPIKPIPQSTPHPKTATPDPDDSYETDIDSEIEDPY